MLMIFVTTRMELAVRKGGVIGCTRSKVLKLGKCTFVSQTTYVVTRYISAISKRSMVYLQITESWEGKKPLLICSRTLALALYAAPV